MKERLIKIITSILLFLLCIVAPIFSHDFRSIDKSFKFQYKDGKILIKDGNVLVKVEDGKGNYIKDNYVKVDDNRYLYFDKDGYLFKTNKRIDKLSNGYIHFFDLDGYTIRKINYHDNINENYNNYSFSTYYNCIVPNFKFHNTSYNHDIITDEYGKDITKIGVIKYGNEYFFIDNQGYANNNILAKYRDKVYFIKDGVLLSDGKTNEEIIKIASSSGVTEIKDIKAGIYEENGAKYAYDYNGHQPYGNVFYDKYYTKKLYYIDNKGKVIDDKRGFISNEYDKNDKHTYYALDDGTLALDAVLNIGGKKYIIDEHGHLLKNSAVPFFNGDARLTDNNGVIIEQEGLYRCSLFDENNSVSRGIASNMYYVNSDGMLVRNTFFKYKGSIYYANERGEVTCNSFIMKCVYANCDGKISFYNFNYDSLEKLTNLKLAYYLEAFENIDTIPFLIYENIDDENTLIVMNKYNNIWNDESKEPFFDKIFVHNDGRKTLLDNVFILLNGKKRYIRDGKIVSDDIIELDGKRYVIQDDGCLFNCMGYVKVINRINKTKIGPKVDNIIGDKARLLFDGYLVEEKCNFNVAYNYYEVFENEGKKIKYIGIYKYR